MKFDIVIPQSFEKKLLKLNKTTRKAASKTILRLHEDPHHPSLKTHKVKNATGFFKGDIFEAYVTIKYRLTWEYGPEQGQITLRNIDNHDQCLQKP